MKNFAAAAAFLGAFAFATHGPLAQQSQPHQHGESPKAGQAQQNGDYDLRFLDMTAMHHEMGVKMSELAGQKAKNAQLKAKATDMAQAQQRDLTELEQLRSKLYPDAPKRQAMSEMHRHMESMGGTGTSGQSAGGHPHEGQSQGSAAAQKGGMMGGDMNGMMAEMNRLEKLTGAEFDQAFAKQMIRHHQMHINMSERATKDAKHDEVREFAQKSITEQKKDISDLERFSGTATPSLAGQMPLEHMPQVSPKAATTKAKPQAGMATDMAAKCQAMMADHEKMMTEMKVADQQLDDLVAKMNAASGADKAYATAAVVNEMVTQRRTMRDGMMKMEGGMMGHMMEHMQAGKDSMAMCPMMKQMGGMKH